MSRHLSPSQVHAKLKHPVVDGDGHWLEFAPVFGEKMRKAGGDKAADGFLAALKSTTDALKMHPGGRGARRVAQPTFWNPQAEDPRARATAISRPLPRPRACPSRASRTAGPAAP